MLNIALKSVACLLLWVLCGAAKAQTLYPVKMDGKWGYIDTAGKLVLQPQYDKAEEIKNGFAKARKGNNLVLIYNQNKIVEIENCSFFQQLKYPYYKARKNNKWWITDTLGNNISENGYDRLWFVKNYDSLLYFSDANKSGVIKLTGEVLLNSDYSNLRVVLPGYFSVMQKSKTILLINRRGENVIPDSFTHIHLVSDIYKLFMGISIHGEKILFTGNGNIAARGKSSLDYTLHANGFLMLPRKDTNFIYDLVLNRMIPIGKKNAEDSKTADCIYIRGGKKNTLYNRYTGELFSAENLQVYTGTYPFLYRVNSKTGLLDSSYKSILEAKYLSISKVENNRMMVMDSNFQYSIFNWKTRKFESEPVYSNFYSQPGFIKAYTSDRIMDLYLIDANGKVSEIVQYKNVFSTIVNSRDSDADSMWTDYKKTKGPFMSSSMGVRTTGWFSKSMRLVNPFNSNERYGLRLKRDSLTWDTVIKPIYPYVEVQKTSPYSIAGFTSKYKSSGIKLQGNNIYYPECGFVIVNDSLGYRTQIHMQYIDRADLNNPATPGIRIYSSGRMYILSKTDMKPSMGCTYISPLEKGGMRRAYFGGNVQGENDAVIANSRNMLDPDFLSRTGIRWYQFRSGYYAYTVANGQWLLMNSDGTVHKPTIAGKEKIVCMGAFDDRGLSIITLSNGKTGVIDTNGKAFINPEYTMIDPMPEMPGHFTCGIKSQKSGLVNSEGEILTSPKFNRIEAKGEMFLGRIQDSTFIFSAENEAVYIGKKRQASGFENGVGFIRTAKGFVLSTSDGLPISTKIYRNAMAFQNGYAPVFVGGKWGLISSNGTLMFGGKFDQAKPFCYTTGVFRHHRNWKFITPDGEKIKGPKRADAVKEIAPGIFCYQRGDKYGVFNAEGKKISNFRTAGKPILLNNQILVCKGTSIQFYDLNGAKTGNLPSAPGLKNKQIEQEMVRPYNGREFGPNVVLTFYPAQMRAFGADSPWTKLIIPLGLNRGNTLQKEYLFQAYENDVFLCGPSGNKYFQNGNGDRLFDHFFWDAKPMQNGRSICKLSPLETGLLDKYGFWLIKPQFQNLKKLNDSIYSYMLAYNYNIIGPDGKIINSEPLDLHKYNNGMLMMQAGNKVGYYKPGMGIRWDMRE